MKQLVAIGMTTFRCEADARSVISALLTEKLIACGQSEGPIRSSYLWKDKIMTETEWRAVLKFDIEKKTEIERMILSLHPYENPQWVYWEVSAEEKYCNWVKNSSQRLKD